MNLKLTNKNAFVCGSTQGIGKAVAIELAELGANVTLIARNEEKLKAAIKDLNIEKGQQHDYIVADFSKPDELKQSVEAYQKRSAKPIHILLNNTGGPPGGPITEATIEEFLSAFNQHLICNHILVQAVLEGMKKEGYGRIINIISTSVKAPLPNLGVSNTIRAAVGNWSKTLANEVGKYGITVNNVLPGATETERLTSIIDKKASNSGVERQKVEEKMQAEIPAGRFGKAEEIAAAAAFLATPAAAYINGINVPVDGGRTVCL